MALVCAIAMSCQAPKEEGDYNIREPISTDAGLDVAITITEERYAAPAEIRVGADDLPKVVQDWNFQDMYEYKIGPEDILSIKVFYGMDSLSIDAKVARNGSITIPLIGVVDAIDKTPEEMQEILLDKFQEYYVNPSIIVDVEQYNSHNVYVMGFGIHGKKIALEKRTTLFEIIPELGGAVQSMDLRGAYLQRGDKIYPVDLKRILEGDLSLNYELEDNDILYIRSLRTTRIFMLGEVNRKGMMPLRLDDNLFTAILRAGGPTTRAQLHDIRIIRGGLTNPTLITVDLSIMFRRKAPRLFTTEDFRRLSISVDASRHSSVSLEKLYLQSEDFIFVPPTALAHWNDVMEEVSPIMRYLFTEPILITRDTILLQNTLVK